MSREPLRAPRARRRARTIAAICLLSAAAVPLRSDAIPIAAHDATYQAFGRVFPDPHGCVRGAPTKSPWAKGNVCAAQFTQWDEALDGIRFLEQRFPRYVQLINLRTMLGGHPEFQNEDLRSAGLPREDLTRDRRDLYVVKVTDAGSPVPENERKHFAYSLSIHGIERAGLEGGIRAIEDLVTWSACEEDFSASPVCEADGPFPKRILEPSNSGPTAGEVLREGVVYFVLANPDGWARGEVTEGGVSFQRYNGNGMDLNRDWPTRGYTEQQYTPASEPETRGYAAYLRWVRENNAPEGFSGAIDLHGMLTARSFSFTLLGAGQRDYRKNALTVDTSILTFRDAEQRLTWSPMIAPAGECPGNVREPVFGGNLPMCSDQWGTVWDTIDYQVTGSFGDWMDSPLGLDAVGIDNEMALSHIAPNTHFDPDVEQLHIDGNKGLIYAQISSLLQAKAPRFEPGGRVAYVFDPERISNDGGATASLARALPVQDTIEQVAANGIQDFSFDVFGRERGVQNGGMTIEATFGNVRGVSPGTTADLILEYCGGADHPGDSEECREVAHYFNQSPLYLQAGARIDLTDPRPGEYRISADPERALPTKFTVSFSRGAAYPEPKQEPYDVSRMDFFKDLNKYAEPGSELQALDVDHILANPQVLNAFDTVVLANEVMPGRYSGAQLDDYTDALRRFAVRGGNVTLTDAALRALPSLVTQIERDDVDRGVFYAGWMDFDDGEGPTYERHHLARAVNKEGTAEGQDSVDGERFDHRHQTYEPVPLGYYVSPFGSGNSDCGSDRCDSPNWMVDQEAWEAAGGTTAARTLARSSTEPDSESVVGTSLGQIRVGKGVVRIAGALLPDPTEQNYHPFGLSSYALTYTGYQVFENAIEWKNPSRVDAVRSVRLSCDACEVGIGRGGSATASFSIRNLGSDEDTFAFAAAGVPEGWTVSFEPNAATTEPWEQGDGRVTVTAPRFARPGTYEMNVRAVSEGDRSAADEAALRVIVARR